MTKYHLITFIISMVPVIELRGAIPYGIAHGLTPMTAFALSVVGNLIPVPFVILLSRKLIEFGKKLKYVGRFFSWVESHAHKKSETVLKYKTLGLLLLVAIPLPGTGAWTGAVVAAIMDLRMKKAVPAIVAGVLIAGAIVIAISKGIIM